MLYDNDDSELLISSSDPRALESSTKARREALKLKLKKEGFQPSQDGNVDPKQALKLSLLKSQMDGKKDEETRKAREVQRGSTHGTKTREQEIASGKMTADAKPSAQDIIRQEAESEAHDDEIQKQEVTGEGG